MSNERTGGPAYPERNFEWDSSRNRMMEVSYRGPNLLDHFAGLAMQAQLEALQRLAGYTPHEWTETEAGAEHAKAVATDSYRYAAAMIAGIAPTDTSEEGAIKTRQFIEQRCQEQGVDVFAFTAWLHN